MDILQKLNKYLVMEKQNIEKTLKINSLKGLGLTKNSKYSKNNKILVYFDGVPLWRKFISTTDTMIVLKNKELVDPKDVIDIKIEGN